ncbi:MAG: hypothetical protein PHH40_00360 [Candidatus Moranbacteria bacterium]|nr:hypothetical protein [Candidatus Moranbacteria bacterium]MDD3964764.1 hypothetical protein [Candidatus Moranbacteria bacterium]
MGLFFSSKKPAVPTTPSAKGSVSLAHKYDRNSRGRITETEFKFLETRLKQEMSHSDAKRILEGIRPNLDSDGHYGGKNISTKEANDSLDYMKRNHHSGLSNSDIEKARDILSEYQ